MKNSLIIFSFALCGIAKTDAMFNVRLMSGRIVYTQEMGPDQPIDRARVEGEVIADHVQEKLQEGVRVDPDILSCKFVGPDSKVVDGNPQDPEVSCVVFEDDVKKALKILGVSPGRIHHDSLILTINSEPEIIMTFTIEPEDNLEIRETFLAKQWQMESSRVIIYNYRVCADEQPRSDKFNATLMFECERIISAAHEANEDADGMTRLSEFIASAIPYEDSIFDGNLRIKIGDKLVVEICKPTDTEKLTKENILHHLSQIDQIYVQGQGKIGEQKIPLFLEVLLGSAFKRESIPEEQKQLTLANILMKIIKMTEQLDGLDFVYDADEA